jgi:hypothetical protein
LQGEGATKKIGNWVTQNHSTVQLLFLPCQIILDTKTVLKTNVKVEYKRGLT